MFGAKNQQKTLVKIPLEQFEDVLDYIHSNINENTPITVLGASKGAEYALTAMQQLATDPKKRQTMGQASLKLAPEPL